MKKLFCVIVALLSLSASAQEKIMLDQIIAIVGNKMVKHSEIEAQMANMRMQGEEVGPDSYCQVLERVMISKLYQNQAELDSVEIPDSEVEANLDRRVRYFVAQIGSRERLEEFYGKPILAIKEEFRDMIKSQMISEKMEGQITQDVRVTPNDVNEFYASLDPDSVPLIPMMYTIQQIVRKPEVTREQKQAVREELNKLRERILAGERFSTLASFYSEDPGSAKKGGELGFFGRGEMYSEFESMAFSLKEGEVSPIIETQAGFHILQLIARQGDQVNVRHLLLMPKADVMALDRARKFLDSVSQLIQDSIYTFAQAAQLFSDDPSGKAGGFYTSPYTGNYILSAEEIEPAIFFVVDKFDEGRISKPAEMETQDREKAMRIVMLTKRTPPHKANLKDDYDHFLNMTSAKARQDAMKDWLFKKIKTTYIQLLGTASDCQYENNWRK